MEVRYHPLFERWLAELAEADEEILGEVMALLTALETHGRDLDDERREESHPVVTSRYDIHALRRTPPSEAAPYADRPPVLRILYAVCSLLSQEGEAQVTAFAARNPSWRVAQSLMLTPARDQTDGFFAAELWRG